MYEDPGPVRGEGVVESRLVGLMRRVLGCT